MKRIIDIPLEFDHPLGDGRVAKLFATVHNFGSGGTSVTFTNEFGSRIYVSGDDLDKINIVRSGLDASASTD